MPDPQSPLPTEHVYRQRLAEAGSRVLELERERDELRGLLLRIHQWDHLLGAADGPFWKREIEAMLYD